jgi:hypothetical protein
MIDPAGNLPHATAGNGLPLSVAPVIVSGGFASICACVAPGPAGPEGRVLSIRTRTVWKPGNSDGPDGSFAVMRIRHRPSIAAFVDQLASLSTTRNR